MTETSSAPLDEARPWITDPGELPRNMNWFAALFNPFGRSPKLHFTRVWTLLLLPRILLYVGLLQLGTATSVAEIVGKIFPVLLLEIIFFISAVRRLNDSGRSVFFAWALFLPALAGLGIAFAMMPSAQVAYKEAVAEYQTAKEDGTEGRRAGVSGRDVARASRGGGGGRGRRGRRGGGGEPGAQAGPPQEVPFLIQKTMGPAGGLWFLGSLIVTIWSAAWLARLPRKADHLAEPPQQ